MPAAKTATRCVFLLRAINVGRRQLPMAALREIAGQLGFADTKTHLASGNLVAAIAGAPAAAAKRLEASITEHFGFHSDVIVRSAAQWAPYLGSNPFPEAAEAEPNRVMLLLANRAPAAEAEACLNERAAAGERVCTVGDGLWIHYAQSVAGSKLTPAFIDQCVGAPATGRNWRTVQALAGLLQIGR
jgi:uncharacterized protein (DUF1697 family)